MGIEKILCFALLVESLWEAIKMIWQEGKFSIDKLGALLLSVGLAIMAKVDVFALMEMDLSVPLLGSVLTGLMISRGSNFIHDLVISITGVSQRMKLGAANRQLPTPAEQTPEEEP